MIGPSRHDILGIGFGPSNLALAIALEEAGRPLRALFLERQERFAWHGDMLLPGTDMQIAFVKDLATLRDPTSGFSFLNYLHAKGRLTAFLNLRTFNPSRVEFNDYLAWAAERLADRVSYGETVEAVEPMVRDGRISAFQVVSRLGDAGRRVRSARHLVVATGGRPHVPAPFAFIGDRRLLHASRYLGGIDAALGGVTAPRIAVIGGGQSAAEIAVDAGERFPQARVDLVIRGHALRPSDDSAFANEIFDPETVDLVHGLDRQRRADLLGQFRNTNYAVVDADLIARFHAILYDERVRGIRRHRLVRDTETMAAAALGDAIVLRLRDRLGGTVEEARYDAVVLATGYDRSGLPDLLEPLRPHLLTGELDRGYRLRLRAADATVHVQGWSEATHGLADTLLSLVAVRAGEIAAAIAAFEAAAERPPARAVGA